MKKLYLVILFLGLVHEIALAQSLPLDAQQLIDQRQAEVDRIDKNLSSDLKKVKARCMKDGDLEAANAVAALIKLPPKASAPEKLDPLAGSVWNFLGVNRQILNKLTLLNSGEVKCENTYTNATWERLDDKTILFCYGWEGSYALLRFTDDTKSYMSGSNVSGRARHLKRLE